MYDKYDSPHGEQEPDIYEKSPIDSATEMGSSMLEQAKPHAKIIGLALVGIVVLFFAYDFFIGSVQQVSFDVTDTEGEDISAAIKVFSLEGQEIKLLPNHESVGLRAGTYKIDVQSSGYKPIRGMQITVSSSLPIAIKLEESKDLELSGQFPAQFASGEQKGIEITITNNDTQTTEAELVLEGDAADIMDLEYEKPLIVQGGENPFTINLAVKKNPGSKQIGDDKSGTIRIKGLSSKDAKIEGKYSLLEFEQDSFSATFGSSKTRADYGRVNAGETDEKILKVENENEFEINQIQVEVQITKTEFSDPQEVSSWFSISPQSTFDVAENSQSQVTVILSVPSSTKFPAGVESESIVGAIYQKSALFERKFDLTMEVEKVESGVDISGIAESYTMQKKDEIYPLVTGFLDVKNSGESLLRELSAKINCTSVGVSWLTFSSQIESNSDLLEEDRIWSIPYTISVPNPTPPSEIATCKIGVFYLDPSSQRQSSEKTIIIRTA